MPLAAAVAALLALSPQDADSERLRRLEDEVRRQKEEIEKLKSARPPENDGGFRGSLTDGLRFRSPEGTVELHIGGRFLEHLRVLPDQPEDSPRLSPDTFLLRSGRIRVDGVFFSQYAFQVDADFASFVNGAAATLQNAYVEWRKFEAFRLQAGQFKVPIGQERLRSQLFSDFVENAPFNRFVPGYDIGLMAYGRLASGTLDYQAALVHGRSHLDNAGRMHRDDNDEKELAARAA
ncbi:MAG: porin, partial [Planctomycetota bacterium]